MVNVFGRRSGGAGERGPRGERGLAGPHGPPGKGGIDDICRWLPASFVLEQFRKTEKACFLLTDEKRDVKEDVTKGYIEWISRSDEKINAIAVRPSKEILHISDHQGALVFDDSLYKVKPMIISPSLEDTYVSLCITYKFDGVANDQQWLVSDWERKGTAFRGVSASDKEIRIWGIANSDKDYMPIEYTTKRNRWTTVFVEWTTIEGNLGRFRVNDKEILGTFICKKPGWLIPELLSIGARLDGQWPFKGAISALEIYVKPEVLSEEERGLPDALQNLIIHDQMIPSPDGGQPPDAKKAYIA